MQTETVLSHASAALERQGARLVDFDAAGVTLESGRGLQKRRLEAPLAPLREWLAAHPAEEARAAVASFFRGLGVVLSAPRANNREAGFGFVEAAGRIMPSLEGPLFATGAELALGEPIFDEAAFDGRTLAYFIELDLGRQLLLRSRVEQWGVTGDRTAKAGLSLLFHKSYGSEPAAEPVEGLSGVQAFRIGDGYDATRAILVESLLFDRCRKGLFLAVPANDVLLLLEPPFDDARLAAFRAHVERLHKESAWPLSRGIYEVRDGVPVAR